MFRRPSSPPPPVPSPQLLPTPLPSPSALHNKPSNRRLRLHSPIGSPLLDHTDQIADNAKAALWVDGDEFGSARSKPSPRSAPKRRHRGPPIHPSYTSPPPSPKLASPTPPVPPIPAFALTPSDKKPILHAPPPLPTWPAKIIPSFNPTCAEEIDMRRKRGLSAPRPPSAMTCTQFMSMHGPPRYTGIKV